MGQNAGRNAINASNANFIIVLEISQQMHINQFHGNQLVITINAYNSNFFGYNSGINASGANSSNFFAPAGQYASGQVLQISLVCRWS
jgi:hypothetical protein